MKLYFKKYFHENNKVIFYSSLVFLFILTLIDNELSFYRHVNISKQVLKPIGILMKLSFLLFHIRFSIFYIEACAPMDFFKIVFYLKIKGFHNK